MLDRDLQTWLQAGDPAKTIDEARIAALTGRILSGLGGQQRPTALRPMGLMAKRLSWVPGAALGVILLLAGHGVGSLVERGAPAPLPVAQKESGELPVMAMATPWDAWIDEGK